MNAYKEIKFPIDWYADTVYVHDSTCIYEKDDSYFYVFRLIAAMGCGMLYCN